MSFLPSMRPDFAIPLPVDGDRVLEALRDSLTGEDAPFQCQVVSGYASLRIPEDRRSLLSPHLELETQKEEGGEILRGRFGPRPTVWTGFMGIFAFIAMLGLTGTVWGLAKMTLGGGALWLLSAPASLALIAFVYGAAFIGQGLSTEEMFDLRSYVEGLVRELDSERISAPGR